MLFRLELTLGLLSLELLLFLFLLFVVFGSL
jgi:hypothetical protein